MTGGRRVPPLNQRKHEKQLEAYAQLAAPTVKQPKPAASTAAGAGAAATGSAVAKAKAPVTVAAQPMMAAPHAAAAPQAAAAAPKAAAAAPRLNAGPTVLRGASGLAPPHALNKERDVRLAQQRAQKARALASLAAAKGKAGADR